MPKQYLKRKLKWITALIIPPILLVIFVFAFSFIGVYIESDKYLLLKGGYENMNISIGVFIFANLFLWMLMFIIKPYKKVLHQGKWSLLFLFLELVLLVFAIFIYYIVLFHTLTNVYLWDIDYQFSENVLSRLFSNLGIIVGITLGIALLANIILYKLQSKNHIAKQIDSDYQEPIKKPTQNTTQGTGGFENMIAE